MNVSELSEIAKSARDEGDFENAARLYTRVTYARLGVHGFEKINPVSITVTNWLRAIVCYRLCGFNDVAERRGRQGRLMLEEWIESLPDSDLERAVLEEYAGDVLLLSGCECWRKRYESALDVYQPYERSAGVSERIGQMAEEPFWYNSKFARELLAGANEELSEEREAEIFSRSPVARIEFKRDRFQALVEDLVENQEWLPIEMEE